MKTRIIENEIHYMMTCTSKAYSSTCYGSSNVTASFIVTMCLTMAVGFIFAVEIATKFLALIFIHLRRQAKIIDIGHGIIASKGVKIRAVYVSYRVRTNPSSDFRIVIALAKVNKANLFINSLATVSPWVPN